MNGDSLMLAPSAPDRLSLPDGLNVPARPAGPIVMIGFGSIGAAPAADRAPFRVRQEPHGGHRPGRSDRALLDERGIRFVQEASPATTTASC
jgi:homospermidine synthase